MVTPAFKKETKLDIYNSRIACCTPTALYLLKSNLFHPTLTNEGKLNLFLYV